MLLAFQSSVQDGVDPRFFGWSIAAGIFVVLLVFLGLFFRMIFKQISKSRELAHVERMKALELGRPVGPSEAEEIRKRYLHNAFWASFWIGGVVPMAAVSAAGTVITQANIQDFGIILAIWICAAVISVASVICATTLMIASRNWSGKSSTEEAPSTNIPA